MGKKRRASQKADGPTGPREVDSADARLGHISDWKDVADSEDEYFMRQDEIALDGGPSSKRRKNADIEDAFLEPSDEEILASDHDSEEEKEGGMGRKKKPGVKISVGHGDASDDEVAVQPEEEEDSGWWGSSKRDYYEADPIATEAEALEEEKEARRIQQKRLAKMTEADFFDETEWLAAPEARDDEEVAIEVLQDMDISSDMAPEEQYGILQTRYPEFSYLVDEFQDLQKLLPEAEKRARGQPSGSPAVAKYYVLGSLVAVLASYFALLTSPARDAEGSRKALSPAELRDHEIMEVLVQCREAWLQVKDIKRPGGVDAVSSLPSPPDEDSPARLGVTAKPQSQTVGDNSTAKTVLVNAKIARKETKKSAEVERREKEVESSLADLSNLLVKPKSSVKPKVQSAAASAALVDDDRSDFGEEEVMDVHTRAEKAARKKSLRFYTSQIVQKSNRRAEGAKNAGGDDDIPYRERLKDRQARLQAQAERRGQRDSKFGADLDSNEASDHEDTATARALRSQEDEYYDMIAQTSAKRKDEKAQKYAAFAEAGKSDRVVEVEQLGEDGKRRISYAIQKNKGLTPMRKKEVKNPRVKKREQFKKKQQKLSSMKPTYKGGEAPGGYGGELTGIKAGLVKSVRL